MREGRVSIDPMCGERVAEDGAESFQYKRKTYYFCSAACRGKFARRAERLRVHELARLGALFAQKDKKARWGMA